MRKQQSTSEKVEEVVRVVKRAIPEKKLQAERMACCQILAPAAYTLGVLRRAEKKLQQYFSNCVRVEIIASSGNVILHSPDSEYA